MLLWTFLALLKDKGYRNKSTNPLLKHNSNKDGRENEYKYIFYIPLFNE